MCADASLNISMLYGGYFPIAYFNLRDQILPDGTFAQNLIVKVSKLVSSDDFTQLLSLCQVLLPGPGGTDLNILYWSALLASFGSG